MSSACVQAVLDRLHGVKAIGADKWAAFCPCHEADGNGHKASLSVAQGTDGRALLHCFGNCPTPDILKAIGMTEADLFPKADALRAAKGRIVKEYDYRDEAGALLFQVVRYDPKDFLQRRPDGAGGWTWKLDGVRRVLYRLPELLAADTAAWVFNVEGEKDADALAALGLVATCNPGGAGKWRPEYSETLRGRRVCIVADKDAPGRKHALDVARAQDGVAACVRVLEMPGDGIKDAADYVEASDSVDAEALRAEFLAMADKTPDWTPPAPAPEPAGPCDFNRTDSGNAELLAHLFGDRLRYDRRRGRWLLWQGHAWHADADGEIDRLVLLAARERFHAAADLADSAEKKRQAEWALTSESRQRREAALALARSVRPIADVGDGWDTEPMLLGVANGVIDLRAGTLRDGKPEDRITLALPWRFRADAEAPRWERFLSEVFAAEAEMIDFISRAVGYGLTGLTLEQCLFICYGIGANGKSVFLQTLLTLLGPLAANTAFQTFELAGRSAASNDVAALADMRIVTAAETNEGARLNEARVKALTGGDTLTARFLYGEFFQFRPAAKFWLGVNHRPRVSDDSDGFWRRVRLIPFLRQFRGADADSHLADTLRAEAEGILAWAVRGCLAWQERGLEPPEAVKAATADYRSEADPLADFLATCTELGPDFEATPAEINRAYGRWAEAEGLRERDRLTTTGLGRRLGERFRKGRDTRGGRVYAGLRVLAGLAG